MAERRKQRERRQPAAAVSLPLLFAPVFAAVYLLHWTLLRLPYYWDEGGYYIPAAWDFFRLGTLIPQSTMSNAHPPVPSILLAAWWKLTGFHIYSTRLLMCVVTTFALLGVFRLARLLAGSAVAFAVLVLTAIYPVWFAQSTLAHADMFAAAFTLWALSFYIDRPGWTAHTEGSAAASDKGIFARALNTGILFSLAALNKETAIVTPAALFCLEAWTALQRQREHSRTRGTPANTVSGVPMLLATAFPVLPLLCWYAYHRAKTGFVFGNPEFLRYNATANLSAVRVLLSLWHRLIHLTVHMNLFVPVLLAVAVLLLPARPGQTGIARPAVRTIAVVLAAHWVVFSILGGALLTRYLLPAYPLLLLPCVAAWRLRTPQWPWLAALSLAGFAVGCEVNPPYPFAPEDNLSYRDMIVLHQQAIHVLQQRYPAATVLSAWPVTADLQRPELGYVAKPMRTAEIPNFTRESVAKAAAEPGNYDTALVFSTKYNPPAGGLNLAGSHAASDALYFDAHRDLEPDEIALALGGRVVWQNQSKGEWAAVLHFDRAYEARNAAKNAAQSGSQVGTQSAAMPRTALPPGSVPAKL